jgi:hypothetical protein
MESHLVNARTLLKNTSKTLEKHWFFLVFFIKFARQNKS